MEEFLHLLSAPAGTIGATCEEKKFLYYVPYWVSDKTQKKIVLWLWVHLNKPLMREAQDDLTKVPSPSQPKEKVLFLDCGWVMSWLYSKEAAFMMSNDNHLQQQCQA